MVDRNSFDFNHLFAAAKTNSSTTGVNDGGG